MSIKLSLLHKGLLLVSIPLCFEIAVFGVLLSLQDQVEREAERLDHKRRVNECVNTIIRDLAHVGQMKKRFQQQGSASATNLIRGYFDEVSIEISKLEDLTKDDDELREPVRISKLAVMKAKTEFTSIRAQIRNASSIEDVNELMIASRKRLDSYLQEALEAGLLDLAAKTEQGADLDTNIPARHNITIFLRYAVGISVLLGVALAVLYSRNQALRIMRVKENTVRFVNNDNLLTVLKGNDEIADLDKAFHEAARQIEAAHRKEAAILENATDLILSIDEDLTIKSINQSSKNTIGKQPDQIIGNPVTSLVFSEDATMLEQSLKQLIHSTTHRAELEVRLLREEDSEPLNVIVSAKYSPRDQTFYCIMHDVTTQREMEKLRREVVAMITHDLRTPLGTIKIFMEMQRDGMFGELNEQGVKLLELADRESKRMATLLDGVLTLEKIRSGNMTLEPVTIDLFDLLNSCSQALALIAQEKKIQIDLKPFDKISIKGDRVWLEQVVINIVSNALKFSPEGSQVMIGGRGVEKKLVEITIADQGPGVPEADRIKIFERFHRVTATSHKVGHGLGLSICKDLILLHNGSISCESTQGKGCTFIILLPLAED